MTCNVFKRYNWTEGGGGGFSNQYRFYNYCKTNCRIWIFQLRQYVTKRRINIFDIHIRRLFVLCIHRNISKPFFVLQKLVGFTLYFVYPLSLFAQIFSCKYQVTVIGYMKLCVSWSNHAVFFKTGNLSSLCVMVVWK